VFAGRESDAAEVYAQRQEAGVAERPRRAEDDLVVHRAAVQRVRVQDERGAARLARGRFQNRLDAPVRRGDEKVSCRVHLRGQRLEVEGL
jgi:hypothetical protein